MERGWLLSRDYSDERLDETFFIRHAVDVKTMEMTTDSFSGRPRYGLFVLAAIVLLVALPIRAYVATRAVMVSRDTTGFVWYAQQLADNPIEAMQQHVQHPLYPALVWGAHASLQVLAPGLTEDPVRGWVVAAVWVTFLSGLVVVVAAYTLTTALFGQKVGLIAAGLTALAAEFCQLSGDGLTDMSHLMFYLFAMTAAIRGVRDRRVGYLGVAGFLSGLAYLVRPEGAEVALVTAGALILFPRNWLRRRRLAGIVAVSLGALLVALPYMCLTGKLVQKKSIQQFWKSSGESAEASFGELQGARANRLQESADVVMAGWVEAGLMPRSCTAVGAIGREPSNPRDQSVIAGVAMGNPWTVVRSLGPITENWGRSLRVTLLLPVVAWLIRRRELPSNTFGCRLVAAVGTLHLLILITLIIQFDYWKLFSLRHVMILAGLTLPFSAAGVAMILDCVPERRRRLVASLLWVGLIGPTLPWMLETRHASNLYLRRAADWVRAHAETEPCVLTNRVRVAFYAGGKYVASPKGAGVGAVLAEARQAGANWLVFDTRRIMKDSPHFFVDLERQTSADHTLMRVHEERGTGKRTGDRAIIYRYRARP